MTDATEDLPEPDRLAAEYVLGLLTGEEELRARGLAAHDADFAGKVAYWEDRFAGLLDHVPEEAPPADGWARVSAATLDTGASPPAELSELRGQLRRWRILAGVTTAAAAALALVIVAGPVLQQAPAPAVATQDRSPLAASIPIGDTSLRLALTYIPGREELVVSASGLAADGVHDHELWLVGEDGALASLGVVEPGAERRVALGDALAEQIHAGSRLVLTREPLGGKPPEAEAGPVVAEGRFIDT